MTSAVKSRTPNLALAELLFAFPNWGDDSNNNIKIIDAAFGAIGLSISGIWALNTAYTVGQLLVDPDDVTLWRVKVAHTSPASGTFAAARTANPTYWGNAQIPLAYRGPWTTATAYFFGDVVYSGYHWAIATGTFTSDVSLAADVTNGDFTTVLDSTATVTATLAAKVAAETAETNAETAETNAETAETNAETAATNAAASAVTAGNSETAAAASAVTAGTHATNAASSASAASTSATNAATAETNAETAETNAETAETNAEAAAAAAAADAATVLAAIAVVDVSRSCQINIDGAGEVLTTGLLPISLEVPYNCTIVAARLLADQTGSIVIDIWKDTYANYPPIDADSITASAPPTISAATKSQDVTLTGWTTSLAKGNILRFNIDSVSTIESCTLVLELQKV